MHSMEYTEEDLEDEAIMWRTATDRNTGNTYYYHVVTRESTWEKPYCLHSAKERAELAWREEQQRNFFAEMEGNIRRKIQQGFLFGEGIGGTSPRAQSPEAERMKRSGAPLCRTISAMDDSVVAELNAIVNPVPYIRRSSSELKLSVSPRRESRSRAMAPVQRSSTATCPPVLHALRWPSGDGEGEFEGDGEGVRRMSSLSSEVTSPSTSDDEEGPPRMSKLMRSEWDEERGKQVPRKPSGPEGPGRRGRGRGRTAWGFANHRSAPSLMRRNSTSTIHLSPHDTLSNPDLDAAILCVCAVFRAHMMEAVMEAEKVAKQVPASPTGREGCAKGRGESGRARGQWDGLMHKSWHGFDEDVSVFDDPPAEESEDDGSSDLSHQSHQSFQSHQGRRSSEGGVRDPGSGSGRRRGDRAQQQQEVPPLHEITAYYRDLFNRTKLKFVCIVLSLIYVERLMKETRGALRPRPSNWKSLLMSVLVLSSKVWDDNCKWNREVSELCPAFTLVRLNELEIAVLEVLRYNVRVLSSEYAKYYFHLRSMCVRGGLSEEHSSITPAYPFEEGQVRVLEACMSTRGAGLMPFGCRALVQDGGGRLRSHR